MDLLNNLGLGFAVALQPVNLAYCFAGVFIGTLVGVLPGIGPVAAMSLLLPVTFTAPPEAGIIMLAGIYYGSMYGGSTTSILVNIPGEAASVVTTLDGHQMARQGRAGPALGIAAIGSFIAGTFAIVGLMLVAPALARFAVRFGPAEYFSLMVLGLSVLTYLSHGSLLKALIMACLGLVLGLVGLDSISAVPRLTFDRMELIDGVGLVPIVMGLFGIAEILIEPGAEGVARDLHRAHQGPPARRARTGRRAQAPLARGSILGFFLGILPGGGAVISSFVSYALEKRLSKTPEKFGKGAIDGVAGPEAANNAAASSGFIPLLTLGIPPNVVVALLLGAFIVHNVQPGPLLMTQNPGLFWGIVASMYIGNVMLLILNLPLIGLWVQVLKVPYRILFPLILLFCLIGVYSISGSIFDIYVMIAFGVLGYLMRKLGYEPAPLVLAFVLGPMMENNLRRALITYDGSFWVFVERPISLACLLLALAAARLRRPAGIAQAAGAHRGGDQLRSERGPRHVPPLPYRASSHTRMALERPQPVRAASIWAIRRETGTPSSSAAALSASQNGASREMEVRWPPMVKERLAGLPEIRAGVPCPSGVRGGGGSTASPIAGSSVGSRAAPRRFNRDPRAPARRDGRRRGGGSPATAPRRSWPARPWRRRSAPASHRPGARAPRAASACGSG